MHPPPPPTASVIQQAAVVARPPRPRRRDLPSPTRTASTSYPALCCHPHTDTVVLESPDQHARCGRPSPRSPCPRTPARVVVNNGRHGDAARSTARGYRGSGSGSLSMPLLVSKFISAPTIIIPWVGVCPQSPGITSVMGATCCPTWQKIPAFFAVDLSFEGHRACWPNEVGG